MVITEQTNNGYRLSLMPNSSISWQGSMLFLFLISLPITIIGVTFFFYGAPLILPFAGLEILIVGSALYVVFNKSLKKEVITLTKEKLTIEKGKYRPDSISEFIREWSYVFVEKPSHHWYPIKIVISSQGEKIAVGDFLTEEEKKEFVSSLEEIISEYRAN
ncbi:MAG: DUF2244 domain-containing protein [Gammaproteobacteria bacterium]|jgi:uncharacterized membrane protein|tara:strand:+ start:11834 stop:12316 length:483 start_codon:yes stop_codon:yes gene_type:complete